jgi:ankyrin repeat protein
MMMKSVLGAGLAFLIASGFVIPAEAQVPPSAPEIAAYQGLHKAAADGDVKALEAALAQGATLDERDAMGRTAFHVAAYQKQRDVMAALAKAGADVNALENQAYDAVTIAAVADDGETLKAALALGNKAGNITSPYDGTALIAAAHLGHDEVVRILIENGAPLNHVNNLGWTALIEAVILGDGGLRHQKTVAHLVKAGANKAIADRNGVTPVAHARSRGYAEIIALLGE